MEGGLPTSRKGAGQKKLTINFDKQRAQKAGQEKEGLSVKGNATPS